ncbi:MAG: hypothetical protein LBN34_01075 [Clostridiales Family XIII bacterium]|jgi:hypothetical protein|nr:hypothetical protein [Clostridiales Family XIII bacterium]
MLLYYVKIAFVALFCLPILYLGIRYLSTLVETASYGKKSTRKRRHPEGENGGEKN